MNSPWLCNLDWTTKKYRGKNTPAECKQLTADIEAFYLKEASADVETEEDKYKYLISSFPSVKKTKCIPHLPNYPESVPELNDAFLSCLIIVLSCLSLHTRANAGGIAISA